MNRNVPERAHAIPGARTVALDTLLAVADGGYASDVLNERMQGLDSRDAGLASQIVFGCLRWQAQLDHLIYLYSGHRAASLDPPVVAALRTAIFQLRYLDRIPPHAAVHETVELIKRHQRKAANLVNAVLRKVNRSPVSWPDLATELSCPEWLLDRWAKHFGKARATGIARAALNEPKAYIRVAPGKPLPDGLEVEATGLSGCYRLLSPVRGAMRLHDIGSQSLIPLLDLQAGHTYLDLCAAPGNKTMQALETALRLAIACDISERRCRQIPDRCPRIVLDASQRLPFGSKFDRIFVDAPCSGTGTIDRNPEIKWRVQPHDFGRFHRKQVTIVKRALEQLAPGGKLLYATCSLEPEENEMVVREVLSGVSHVGCETESWRVPGEEEGDGFYAAILRSGA